jgi:hypothetical protein
MVTPLLLSSYDDLLEFELVYFGYFVYFGCFVVVV